MELNEQKIVFCFPYRGAGGVPLLFIRLAKKLKLLNYDVYIVDYADGFMSSNNCTNIKFIEYSDNKEVLLPLNSILVLQAMTPWSIYSSLKIEPDTRMFYIATLPTNFYPYLPVFRDIISHGEGIAKLLWSTVLRSEFNKSKRLIDVANAKQSLVFLDKDIICNVQCAFSINLEQERLLPLFSDDVQDNLFVNKVPSEQVMNMGWVGRLSDFKIHILNKVLIDLEHYVIKQNRKIKFYVVGDGEKSHELYTSKSNQLIIERVKFIDVSKLNDFLLQLDIYFAMGTAALDGAKIGVPTVRLDYSFHSVSEYKYKFLFEVLGYSLAELIGSKCYTIGFHTMEEVITKVLENRNHISESTFEYYKKNHTLNEAVLSFLEYLKTSELKYDDLKKDNLIYSPLYTMWNKLRGN